MTGLFGVGPEKNRSIIFDLRSWSVVRKLLFGLTSFQHSYVALGKTSAGVSLRSPPLIIGPIAILGVLVSFFLCSNLPL